MAERVREIFERCADKFRDYEREHLDKAKAAEHQPGEHVRAALIAERTAKAETNREMAELAGEGLSELDQLLEEVAHWRRNAYARAWFAAVHLKAAKDKGDMQLAAEIQVGQLDPALHAIRDAEAKQWHTTCEGCGKPLLNGQLYHPYEDASVHVNCDDPAAAVADEHSLPWDDGFSPARMDQMLAFARGVREEEADA